MSLKNIFLKLAHDVSRYPNIVQLTNTLDHGFKEVAAHIQDGGSEVEVTPVYTSGEKLATVTVDDVDHDIYMPNGEVKTMEGSSFKTVNGSLLDEMKIGFTPIQDLHGYSKPWVGGAGKNILPCTLTFLKSANTSGVWADNVYTISDLTITVTAVEDAVTKIDVNGTASARVNFVVGDSFTLTNGVSYTISGSTDGNTTDKWCIYVAFHGSNPSEMSGNGEGTFTYVSGQAVTTTLVVFSGASPSHQPFYPMIRLASIADPTFEPYSNICPISGHTQAQSKINDTTYTTSLGGTYYGGDVEQVGGTGHNAYASLDVNDFPTINGTSGGGLKYLQYAISQTSNMQILSNMLPTVSGTGWWETNPCVVYVDAGGGNWVIRIFVDVTDLTDFQSKYSDLQIAYKLATPTTLTLTGQNIVADVGVNEVSTPLTGQSIEEVKYHQMMTIQDVEKLIQ